MEKLKMQTANMADENFRKLAALFPNALTETIGEDGEVVRAIDADVLRQEISAQVVEGKEERYQFTWPDKKKAIVLTNTPISNTLRLDREKSVGRDGTPGEIDSENIYIEGDNLDVLKLLRETYLGKVKMIYIDPPYNTGNDFIYNDDFSQAAESYLENSGQFDDEGNRLVQNTESNGRFHTDWLNMLYPRLRIAKDLLSDNGVIFISIDDNEVVNLRKICNDIFGETAFVAQIAYQRTYAPRNDSKGISQEAEYLVVYSRQSGWSPKKLPRTKEMNEKYGSPDNDEKLWRPDNPCGPGASSHQGMVYAIQHPFTGEMLYPSNNAHWRYQQKDMLAIMQQWGKYELRDIHDNDKRAEVCGVSATTVREGVCAIVLTDKLDEAKKYAQTVYDKGRWPLYYFTKGGTGGIAKKTYLNEENGKVVTNLWLSSDIGHTDEAKKELLSLFDGRAPFDTPKPTRLIDRILYIATETDDIVLDFFSGSATTAHSVMKNNSLEFDSNRKYIMVQLPEKVSDETYNNLCDIGEERIRRAGKKIKEETGADIDYGFRVFKVDSTNMKDVYYNPAEMQQMTIIGMEDNIKPDRTPEDLLFQVMLDLGVMLSSKIEETEIDGKKVFNVADGFLIACFDKDVTDETVKAIAQKKPYYAVFRDSSMANDSVATNFDQIFESYSPDTVRKVL